MKIIFICLLLLSQMGDTNAMDKSVAARDSVGFNYRKAESDPIITVVNKFLIWYKQNYEKLKTIKIVPQTSGEGTIQYRVDFKAVDLYLTTLKSSSCLSDLYLANLRKVFEESDKEMLLQKQTDGPPAVLLGADMVFRTHEIKDCLSTIDQKMKFYPPIQKNGVVTVCVELIAPFKFSLAKEAGSWKIIKGDWPEIGEKCE